MTGRIASVMADLRIETASGTEVSEIVVRPGVLEEVGALLAAVWGKRQVLLVTDARVEQLYAKAARASLEAAGFEVRTHAIEPGEASKRLPVAESLYADLARAGVARDGAVVALGGGVVSDLAGFVAATWMRGIPFAILPTTLEADVDASLGGKTAVNIAGGKNLVGAFHQPRLVAVDPRCLRTLPERDVRAGLGESIKHALITGAEFLAWHEEQVEAILTLEQETLAELIRRNLRIKAAVVERDTFERSGARVVLNFGHTLGHAIEEAGRYVLRHGECVGLGMLAACRLAHSLGMLDAGVPERVETVLARFGLPTGLRERVEVERILDIVRNDKKVQGRKVRYVLLEAIGKPVLRDDVPETAVAAAYESLCE